jgi:hypothetical protein
VDDAAEKATGYVVSPPRTTRNRSLPAAALAHAAAVAELDRLDQSLLARAFSGTLVPQPVD